jgi:DNA-binding PadR family transcriptional regulator
MLAPAKLAQGDLRLIALALIAEAPRHGYEIVKLIEKKTADWHSPAPSILYPTLANLEEAGYLTASADPPRLFTITDDGRAYLKQNRDLADGVLDRLTALGERVSRWRRALGTDGTRLDPDADSTESLTEILARAAGNLQQK